MGKRKKFYLERTVCNRIFVEVFYRSVKATHVKWFTGSQAAATVIEVGSMKFDLYMLAVNIFTFCINNQITLDIQWIPREQNTQADYISKLIDPDYWQITEALFDCLETLWGPHMVDCFANYYNHKLPRFFPDTGTQTLAG